MVNTSIDFVYFKIKETRNAESQSHTFSVEESSS